VVSNSGSALFHGSAKSFRETMRHGPGGEQGGRVAAEGVQVRCPADTTARQLPAWQVVVREHDPPKVLYKPDAVAAVLTLQPPQRRQGGLHALVASLNGTCGETRVPSQYHIDAHFWDPQSPCTPWDCE
jgi:hypothetical protein